MRSIDHAELIGMGRLTEMVRHPNVIITREHQSLGRMMPYSTQRLGRRMGVLAPYLPFLRMTYPGSATVLPKISTKKGTV